MQPITFDIDIHLDGPAGDAARRALNALHGRPEGVPLDERAPDALREAHHILSASHRVRVELYRIDDNGAPHFRIVE